MIVVVQRVREASVVMRDGDDAGERESIGVGVVALIGVETSDTLEEAHWCADKIARLRIFSDDDGKMNRSVIDLLRQGVNVGALVVSQFTLAGDARKGNRPNFMRAATPMIAAPLVEGLARRLEEEHHLPVARGRFGAMMDVALVNDGPVTIVLEKRPQSQSA